jgi:hypothetical protein
MNRGDTSVLAAIPCSDAKQHRGSPFPKCEASTDILALWEIIEYNDSCPALNGHVVLNDHRIYPEEQPSKAGKVYSDYCAA